MLRTGAAATAEERCSIGLGWKGERGCDPWRLSAVNRGFWQGSSDYLDETRIHTLADIG